MKTLSIFQENCTSFIGILKNLNNHLSYVRLDIINGVLKCSPIKDIKDLSYWFDEFLLKDDSLTLSDFSFTETTITLNKISESCITDKDNLEAVSLKEIEKHKLNSPEHYL